MSETPRAAFFCETFHEVNGVALTARQLVAFAERHEHPMLAVHAGAALAQYERGSVKRIELPRGWASFGIERDLGYDLHLWRFLPMLRKELAAFRPDVIHATSPGDFGQLGAILAHEMRIPLVVSWHTNLHQFGGRRLKKLLRFLPENTLNGVVASAERASLRLILRFYKIARVILAPTASQVVWLRRTTGKPTFLMTRGVDSELFHPRHRSYTDDVLRLGFVGRVTPEKGVRLFPRIEKALLDAGIRKFQIVIVGDGSECEWLKSNLRHGVFPGVLLGQQLAAAYANLNLFVFPSRTDTFGNVIQEAAASGVPSVVTTEGGPQHLITPGVSGYAESTEESFVTRVVELAQAPEKLRQMGEAARALVSNTSWDAALAPVFDAYRYCQSEQRSAAPSPKLRAVPNAQTP
ncbi:MAG TPA: glycosyltransferase [Candidatus Acidoferrum sp.]|nr:glycosyltransferase [Candidatus Acidoferrum sp.]